MYRVEKVLNHNALIGIPENTTQEYLILGKGIGFGKHISETIEVTDEHKVYSLQESTERGDKKELATSIDPVYLEIANEILDGAEAAFKDIDRDVLLPLADHIEFAVKRIKNNEQLKNPLTDDIRVLFHAEFKVAEVARDILAKRLNIAISDDEIGYIALHVHSSIMDQAVSQAMQMADAVRQCVKMVEEETGKRIDTQSLSYNRLLNHIRYMIARTVKGEVLKLDMNDYINASAANSFQAATKICKELSKSLGKDIHDAEIGYLAMHIERVALDEMD
ncbi:transcriptional antiterminator, BglG family [Pseudobutyrivibrio sp. YE44]|uniref:PRD domain-containing protein n=1 Tax=Pseudobutyrivibrio sp. YE44 TaxID=1520802 RepID=UPI00087E43D5|nr:PRD domain-containing protein [Pseudobutyrivibrio sp. YE44]SDB06129.1 transcriptional antiterminator, BglG family [Pseudobutyrivibrio sp. YE44]